MRTARMTSRSVKLFLAASILAAVTGSQAQAQSLLNDKRDLTGFAARKIIEACFAQAARDHYPIALAVTDSGGNLLLYEAMDGASAHTGLTAQLKAKTAAKFRRSTGELYERVNKQINRAPEWMGYFPIPAAAKSSAPSARGPTGFREARTKIARKAPFAR